MLSQCVLRHCSNGLAVCQCSRLDENSVDQQCMICRHDEIRDGLIRAEGVRRDPNQLAAIGNAENGDLGLTPDPFDACRLALMG